MQFRQAVTSWSRSIGPYVDGGPIDRHCSALLQARVPTTSTRDWGFPYRRSAPAKYNAGSDARTRASGSPNSRRTILVPSTSETHL